MNKVINISSADDFIIFYKAISALSQDIEDLTLHFDSTFNYLYQFTSKNWRDCCFVLARTLEQCTALKTLRITEENGCVNNLHFLGKLLNTTTTLNQLSYTSAAARPSLPEFLESAVHLSQQLTALELNIKRHKNFSFTYLKNFLTTHSTVKKVKTNNLSITLGELSAFDSLLKDNPQLQSITLNNTHFIKDQDINAITADFSHLATHPSLIHFIVANTENQESCEEIGVSLLRALEKNHQVTLFDSSALHNGIELATPSGLNQQQLVRRNQDLLERTHQSIKNTQTRITPYQEKLLDHHSQESLEHHELFLMLLRSPDKVLVPFFQSKTNQVIMPFDVNKTICSFLSTQEQSMVLFSPLIKQPALTPPTDVITTPVKESQQPRKKSLLSCLMSRLTIK
jgi:hypothetical protein